MPNIPLSPWFPWAIGSVFLCLLGLLSRFSQARQSVDIWIRDTYYPIAHFHVILAFAVVFIAFAGVYAWFPQIVGRNFNDRLGQLHFFLTMVGVCVLILTLRTSSVYPGKKNIAVLFLALLGILAAQLLFVLNLFLTLLKRGK